MDEMRGQLKALYIRYDIYFKPVLKFILALVTFMLINNKLGYSEAVNNMFVMVILALVCSILPLNGLVTIGTLLIIINCLALGVEIGGLALVLYLLMILLYFRFVPDEAIAVVLTPIAFLIHGPLALPLCLGMTGGVTSVISASFGVISWQFMDIVATKIAPMKETAGSGPLEVLQRLPKELLSTEAVLNLILFIVIILAGTAVRKLFSRNIYETLIGIGAVLYLALSYAGHVILGVDLSIPMLLINTLVSLVIAAVFSFFLFRADYSGAEFVRFEDDRNYYFVKVIPKIEGAETALEKDLDTYRDLHEEEVTRTEESGDQAISQTEDGDLPEMENSFAESAGNTRDISGDTRVLEGLEDYSGALENSLDNMNLRN